MSVTAGIWASSPFAEVVNAGKAASLSVCQRPSVEIEAGEKACHKQAAIDLRQLETFPVSCDGSHALDIGLPVN